MINLPLFAISQRVAGASTALGVLLQDAFVQEVFDISEGGIGRAFGDCGPFGGFQFSVEAVEEFV